MISEITFITGNTSKYDDAVKLFKDTGIKVLMEKHDTPEIQSTGSEEVSVFSAEFLKDKLKKPYFVMDRSFHIEALKGFPGPYIKYINNWLSTEQILTLLTDETNRKAYWETSISCFVPGKGIATFTGINNGSVAEKAVKGKGWLIDEVFIPENAQKTLSQFEEDESVAFWNSTKCWKELVDYLLNC